VGVFLDLFPKKSSILMASSTIQLLPAKTLTFSIDSGSVRPFAVLEIQHTTTLNTSAFSLAAFKLKLNNVRRFTVSKKCGWIVRGETIKVRIEFIAQVGEKIQHSNDLFSVETLCINDADELASFVSSTVSSGSGIIPFGSSPNVVAERLTQRFCGHFVARIDENRLRLLLISQQRYPRHLTNRLHCAVTMKQEGVILRPQEVWVHR